MEDRVGCGSHGTDGDNGTGFDHTCDDCMLPEPHYDPPELNDLSIDKQERYTDDIKSMS